MKVYKQITTAAACFQKDPVLFTAMAAAIVSAVFVPPSKEYFSYIDLRVICLLLSLMLVVAGLQKAGVFDLLTDRLLRRIHNTRMLSVILVGICFFSSMLITNDVALITFVPLGVITLTQIQKQKLLIPVIVLQTVAANLGSMLTPLGNPQNLYLYSFYNISIFQFLQIMAVPTIVSILLFSFLFFLIKPEPVNPVTAVQTTAASAKSAPFAILFIVCLLAVLRVIPYGIALAAVIAGVLIFDRKLFFRADYGLLLTFIFLFIFIGNIKSIPAINSRLSALVCGRELPAGILLSQVISNVPAAMLLSKFTENYSLLLVGVNLGGLGTLIASMASVISYKLYASTTEAKTGKYLVVFTVINLLFLGILYGSMTILNAMQ